VGRCASHGVPAPVGVACGLTGSLAHAPDAQRITETRWVAPWNRLKRLWKTQPGPQCRDRGPSDAQTHAISWRQARSGTSGPVRRPS
jgi:hypothetical protein